MWKVVVENGSYCQGKPIKFLVHAPKEAGGFPNEAANDDQSTNGVINSLHV